MDLPCTSIKVLSITFLCPIKEGRKEKLRKKKAAHSALRKGEDIRQFTVNKMGYLEIAVECCS